jgi:hypothetical protein
MRDSRIAAMHCATRKQVATKETYEKIRSRTIETVLERHRIEGISRCFEGCAVWRHTHELGISLRINADCLDRMEDDHTRVRSRSAQ